MLSPILVPIRMYFLGPVSYLVNLVLMILSLNLLCQCEVILLVSSDYSEEY